MFKHPIVYNPDFHTTLITWHDGGLHFFERLPEGSDGLTLLTLYYATYITIIILACICAWTWQKRGSFRIERRHLLDCMIMAAVGGVFGARLGEVIFYHPQYFLEHPRLIVEGTTGYSVHGAIAGAVLALFVWSRWIKRPLRHILDQAAIILAFGTLLGRITSFVMGELPGRPASPDLPWAIQFPLDALPRHPVMLYQALSEGLLLLIVLLVIRSRARYAGTQMAAAMIGYGILRTVMEFFREPDAGIAYPFLGLTVGQLLSIAFALLGCLTLWYNRRHPVEIVRIGGELSGVGFPRNALAL